MSERPQQILIIGAGIVGSALAHFLSSTSSTKREITVVDRSLSPLVGSTGHAPGFVGQFNESEVLTRLAIDTVQEYCKIPNGFASVGGLEVAFSSAGIDKLKARQEKAAGLGIPAEIISIERAGEIAPNLVEMSKSGAALYFPTDGTANASTITSYYQECARKAGVQFVEADVKGLLVSDGRAVGAEVQHGQGSKSLKADWVVLATGIWAQDLCQGLNVQIPVVPVGHPYMHGRERGLSVQKSPFVRWPEHHVYARDHGTRYGIGTYDHTPIHYRPVNGTAIGNWIKDFDEALKDAVGLLPDVTEDEFKKSKAFNGIFSMTPDNMPLAGTFKTIPGLCCAVAVWVTHAAGTAKFVAKLIHGEEVDRGTQMAVDPDRFRGQDDAELERMSLNGYNEIYKTVDISTAL